MSTSATRYPAAMQHRARELRAAGWTIRRIAQLVEDETGHRPSVNTVWRWLDDRNAAKNGRRGYSRAVRAGVATYAFPGLARSDDWLVGRIRALANVGVPAPSIAKVMRVDFPDRPMTATAIRAALATGQLPRRWTPAPECRLEVAA